MEEQSSNRRGGKKERKKERITGNKKNIKVKNKKSHHYMMTFNKTNKTSGQILVEIPISMLNVSSETHPLVTITQQNMNGF